MNFERMQAVCPQCKEGFTVNDPYSVRDGECPYCGTPYLLDVKKGTGWVIRQAPAVSDAPSVLGVNISDGTKTGEAVG